MKLPQLNDFDFKGKKVLVRCDLDVPLVEYKSGRVEGQEWRVGDDERIKECLPTIECLLKSGASVIILGHLGRPEGKTVKEFSLWPVAEKLKELLGQKFETLNPKSETNSNSQIFKIQNFLPYRISNNVYLLENLRFDHREEDNDLGFAKELADLGDFFVNEAFATSHREHASIVGIPKFLPHCAGFHFINEVENLSKAIGNPKRPLFFIIGGAKPETKLPFVEEFSKRADWVLVGGTLVKHQSDTASEMHSRNVLWANLTDDGFDINEESIERFTEIIKTAGTVVWNGPLGKVEEPEGQEGTRRIGEVVGDCGGVKIVGGGDTIAVLKKFKLLDKMDYVSSGGGAMLEFLAKGTLPGIRALE